LRINDFQDFRGLIFEHHSFFSKFSYLLESIEVTLIFVIFEDENFVESKTTAKSASLENLYVYYQFIEDGLYVYGVDSRLYEGAG